MKNPITAKREVVINIFLGPKKSAKFPPIIPPAKFPNPIEEFNMPTPLPLSFPLVKSDTAEVDAVMNKA